MLKLSLRPLLYLPSPVPQKAETVSKSFDTASFRYSPQYQTNYKAE
jgi:hypothetical protein